jgi:hypothetical protein
MIYLSIVSELHHDFCTHMFQISSEKAEEQKSNLGTKMDKYALNFNDDWTNF